MPEPPHNPFFSGLRILYETVLFRYCTEEGTELTGEAMLMLERDERSGLLRSLHVTLLSVFNLAGEEVYGLIWQNTSLRKRLEIAVVEHYYHPPAQPIQLPRRVIEW